MMNLNWTKRDVIVDKLIIDRAYAGGSPDKDRKCENFPANILGRKIFPES
jgi:hypothetical protein